VREMKQLSLDNTVDMMVEGEVEQALQTISVEVRGIKFERLGANTVRVAFDHQGEFTAVLSQVLDAFSRHGVVLKTIHPAGNLEDAFLKTLAEDRRRGFARAFENEGAIDQLGVRATPVIPEPAEPPPDKPSPDKDAQ
jgi:hypothetical protein